MRSSSLLLSRGYLSSPSVVVRAHYRVAVLALRSSHGSGPTRIITPLPHDIAVAMLVLSLDRYSPTLGCGALSHPLSRQYLNVVLYIDPLPPFVLHPWRFGFPPIGSCSMVASGHHPLYTCKLWPLSWKYRFPMVPLHSPPLEIRLPTPIGARRMVASGHHSLFTRRHWPDGGGSTDSPRSPHP